MTKKELWLRIREYHFEHLVPPSLLEKIGAVFGGADASTRAFADKIGNKHNWEKQFALMAVYEYKKFVYLGVTSNFHVTPSKIIDVVWHEHLLFSKAYRDFCETILETNFDHFPELIVIAEQTGKFNAQYLETLIQYEKEFGIPPPDNIWEQPKFEKEKISDDYQKQNVSFSRSTNYYDDNPLYINFSSDNNGVTYHEFEVGGNEATSDWSIDASDDSDGDGGGCSSGCGGGGD